MKPRSLLAVAGAVLLFAPGCCVLDHLYGCGPWWAHGCVADHCSDGCKASRKCDKKCRKCRECLEEHGQSGGMMMGGMGLGGGCGCGGCGMPEMMGGFMGEVGGGGCASCGHGGHGHGGAFDAPHMMTTPPMTIPTPSALPHPQPGTALPPPIPPADSSSTNQIPSGTQQVSVEEFQRLPGVVISGPGSQPAAAMQPPQMAAQPVLPSVPASVAAPPATARPVQTPAVSTTAPANARQVQQTGWAPVRK